MFPLKNKRSGKYKKDAVKDGICPHCGEVRFYNGILFPKLFWNTVRKKFKGYVAYFIGSHHSTMWKNSIFSGMNFISTKFIFQWKYLNVYLPKIA